jgi:hypothetical protein
MTTFRHIDFNPPGWGEFAGVPPTVDDAHRQAVLADRPVAFWPLDEPAGATQHDDLQRGGHHATPQGAVTAGHPGPFTHEADTAVDLQSAYFTCPSLSSFGADFPQGFTFAAWLRTTTSATGGLISGFNPGGTTALLVELNRDLNATPTPGRLRCFLRDDAGRTLRADTSVAGLLLDGAWHHVAVTYDPAATAVGFWVDGQPLTTSYGVRQTPQQTSALTVPLTLGAFRTSSAFISPLTGRLSHASLFGRALAAEAIAAHVAAGTGPVAVSLTQAASAAYPDDGPEGMGVRAEFGEGNAGRRLSLALPAGAQAVYGRVAVAGGGMASGRATLMRCQDASGRPLAWLTLDSDRSVRLETAEASSSAVPLPALAWASLEMGLDPVGGVARLYIDGVSRGTASLPVGAESASIEVGVMDGRAATGGLALDDWVVADGPIGPPVREPAEPHAGDPARWLVLYRADQAESVAWADRYRLARGVPLGNLLGLTTADAESVDAAEVDALRQAIRDRLAHGPLGSRVVGVLLGPGLPGLINDGAAVWPVAACIETDDAAGVLAINPLGGGAPARPTAEALAGRRIVARIDGDADLAHAVLDRSLDRSSRRLGGGDTLARLYVDPYGLPITDWLHTTTLAAWAESPDARRLRLSIDVTTADDRSFDRLEHDAFYLGYASGSPGGQFFGEAEERVVFVQPDATQSVQQTLRSGRGAHWPGAALDAGYAATITATSTYTPEAVPDASRFFEALWRGWTLGEAWGVCRPTLGTPLHLVGDPLMTVRFPSGGYRLYGPGRGVADALGRPPLAELPAGSAEASLDAGLLEPGVYVVTAVDAEMRENAAASAIRVEDAGGGLLEPPRRPVWPRRSGWRWSADHAARLAYEQPLRTLSLRSIVLEAEDAASAITTVGEVSVESSSAGGAVALGASDGARRFRWRVVGWSGQAIVTPWSAWRMPTEGVLADGPVMEVSR